MTKDLNDSLDDLLGGPIGEVRRPDPTVYQPKEHYFTEACKACNGSGKFRSYTGRLVGDCFKCKGKGERTFRTSSEARAQARTNAATRKADRKAADLETFKTAQPAVWNWLETNAAKGNSFAQSLRGAIDQYGDLTPGQLAAVEKAIARDQERAKERQDRVDNAPAISTTKLEAAFDAARAKADRPNALGVWVKPITMRSGETDVRISEGSAGSQWQGMLFIKTADGKKLGHIKGGKFIRRYECNDVEAEAVMDCASDPLKAAIAYGKAWSRCAVCARTLTNDGSIERGIGPICAEKFGW